MELKGNGGKAALRVRRLAWPYTCGISQPATVQRDRAMKRVQQDHPPAVKARQRPRAGHTWPAAESGRRWSASALTAAEAMNASVQRPQVGSSGAQPGRAVIARRSAVTRGR